MKWADKSVQALQESLDATNVLSEEYKSLIVSFALGANQEGYKRGLAQGKAIALKTNELGWVEGPAVETILNAVEHELL